MSDEKFIKWFNEEAEKVSKRHNRRLKQYGPKCATMLRKALKLLEEGDWREASQVAWDAAAKIEKIYAGTSLKE